MYRFYSNPTEAKVRVSVIGEFFPEEKVLKVAVSRCSKKDSFIRAKGRAIAEGRLHKGKLYDKLSYETPPTSEEFIAQAKLIAEEVIDSYVVCSNC